MFTPALIALEDGSIFKGVSVGAAQQSTGEVVFNTAMTGYQEILTDPSYAQQIVTLTYPHIGNVGVNYADDESGKIWAAGLIVRDHSCLVSNWRSSASLTDFLVRQNVAAIAGIDTRRLTRILREKGAQRGCIITGKIDPDYAIQQARQTASLNNLDLAKVVSTRQAYSWQAGTWDLDDGASKHPLSRTVVVYDFGVKRNILRMLVDRGCRLTIVPAKTPASDVLAMNPQGVVLSNGPGDPAPCDYAIEATRVFLQKKIPLLGICLGFQLLALAAGGKTYKMKFGHHGANHPVQEIENKKIMITSQNHGFAVDESSLPANIKITHRSLFDGSLQGLALTDAPAFGFQGHPEASPGPHDISGIFDHFITFLN